MCLGKVGRVLEVWEDAGVPMGLVEVGSGTETACLLTCRGADVGSSVLVHLGFVVEVLDPALADEARRLRVGAMSEEEQT